MAEMRRFTPADFLLLLVVLAVAAGARVGYLWTQADKARAEGPFRVQERIPPYGSALPDDLPERSKSSEMEVLIHNVQKHLWFGCHTPFAKGEEETAHVSPGYPFLVGLLGRQLDSTGMGQDRDQIVRWIQAGLGSLTAAFYFLFARRAFRSLMVGTLAGLFAALHPFWIISVATIDDGVLASFALAGCLLLAGQAGEKGGPLRSLLLGASLAGLSLVRAALLPFSFVVLIWYLLRSRALSMGGLCALCAFLGFVAAQAPWAVRNYQVFKEPVPVVSSTYLHLWIGNNDRSNGGSVTDDIWQQAVQDETPLPAGQKPLIKELEENANQPLRYARLGQEVIATAKKEPGHVVRQRFQAAMCFLFGKDYAFPSQESSATPLAEFTSIEEEDDSLNTSVQLTLQAVLLAMLLLAFLGWRWSYGWRWESIPAALAVMWVPLPYILGHAENLSGPRLPLDGVLLTFAAFALCCFLPRVGGHLLNAADAGEPKPKETAT